MDVELHKGSIFDNGPHVKPKKEQCYLDKIFPLDYESGSCSDIKSCDNSFDEERFSDQSISDSDYKIKYQCKTDLDEDKGVINKNAILSLDNYKNVVEVENVTEENKKIVLASNNNHSIIQYNQKSALKEFFSFDNSFETKNYKQTVNYIRACYERTIDSMKFIHSLMPIDKIFKKEQIQTYESPLIVNSGEKKKLDFESFVIKQFSRKKQIRYTLDWRKSSASFLCGFEKIFLKQFFNNKKNIFRIIENKTNTFGIIIKEFLEEREYYHIYIGKDVEFIILHLNNINYFVKSDFNNLEKNLTEKAKKIYYQIKFSTCFTIKGLSNFEMLQLLYVYLRNNDKGILPKSLALQYSQLKRKNDFIGIRNLQCFLNYILEPRILYVMHILFEFVYKISKFYLRDINFVKFFLEKFQNAIVITSEKDWTSGEMLDFLVWMYHIDYTSFKDNFQHYYYM